MFLGKLHQQSDFDGVFAAKQRLHGRWLSLHYRYEQVQTTPETTQSPALPRLGMLFGRRFLRSAVDRNRLKRVARETFRLHLNEQIALGERCNLSLIVRLSRKLDVAVRLAVVEAELRSLMRRLFVDLHTGKQGRSDVPR